MFIMSEDIIADIHAQRIGSMVALDSVKRTLLGMPGYVKCGRRISALPCPSENAGIRFS
jgi:hypothetical protein